MTRAGDLSPPKSMLRLKSLAIDKGSAQRMSGLGNEMVERPSGIAACARILAGDQKKLEPGELRPRGRARKVAVHPGKRNSPLPGLAWSGLVSLRDSLCQGRSECSPCASATLGDPLATFSRNPVEVNAERHRSDLSCAAIGIMRGAPRITRGFAGIVHPIITISTCR